MNLLLFVGSQIQWLSVLIAVGIVVGVAILLGICIMVISKLCEVKTDPRIKEVEQCLGGANCGACGFAGCADYAKALVEGRTTLDECGQTTPAGKTEISNILGMTIDGSTEPTIAVVACAGGSKCNDKYSYQGYGNCVSQNMLAGGRKVCETGCMGSGSCVDACPYLCVECYDGYAHIDPELCRSCGLCIKACPKNIIKRIEIFGDEKVSLYLLDKELAERND